MLNQTLKGKEKCFLLKSSASSLQDKTFFLPNTFLFFFSVQSFKDGVVRL